MSIGEFRRLRGKFIRVRLQEGRRVQHWEQRFPFLEKNIDHLIRRHTRGYIESLWDGSCIANASCFGSRFEKGFSFKVRTGSMSLLHLGLELICTD